MIQLPEGQEWVFEMINNILIEVLASIAELERLTTRQRQAEELLLPRKKEHIWAAAGHLSTRLGPDLHPLEKGYDHCSPRHE